MVQGLGDCSGGGEGGGVWGGGGAADELELRYGWLEI